MDKGMVCVNPAQPSSELRKGRVNPALPWRSFPAVVSKQFWCTPSYGVSVLLSVSSGCRPARLAAPGPDPGQRLVSGEVNALEEKEGGREEEGQDFLR